MAELRIGTSGWVYPEWRGGFYPKGLGQREELAYLAGRINSVEINGSFYSLQRPERYEDWYGQAPQGFIFSVKGPRYITHLKQLRDCHTALANFFASGVLGLKDKLGPILWQLPPQMTFNPDRLAEFFALLPRTTHEATALAKHHNDKLKSEPHLKPGPERGLRYALEIRHRSFDKEECVNLLRDNDIALVAADSAKKWPYLEYRTADFRYVRLHGGTKLYVSGYSAKSLANWAEKVSRWLEKDDVYVYFDNTAKMKAPTNAIDLAKRLTD